MCVSPLNIQRLPSLYREILQREVEKLKKRDEVLAIGVARAIHYKINITKALLHSST